VLIGVGNLLEVDDLRDRTDLKRREHDGSMARLLCWVSGRRLLFCLGYRQNGTQIADRFALGQAVTWR
jgi:hypothetical protein